MLAAWLDDDESAALLDDGSAAWPRILV